MEAEKKGNNNPYDRSSIPLPEDIRNYDVEEKVNKEVDIFSYLYKLRKYFLYTI